MLRFMSSLRARVMLIIILAILPSLLIFYSRNQKERNNEINHLKQDLLELAEIISLQETDLLEGTRQLLITTSLLEEKSHQSSGEGTSRN